MSFDEFLALEGNQSEFDRRVQKAVNTAVTNAQTKWKTLTDDKVSEAEKLAQMTNEEKSKLQGEESRGCSKRNASARMPDRTWRKKLARCWQMRISTFQMNWL